MPSMANITVKKADGTTDVVFSAMAPSSGDSVPAVWRAEALSGVPANRPRFEMRTRWNGSRDARRADLTFYGPSLVTNSTTSTTTVAAAVPMNVTVTIPTSIPDTEVDDLVAYATNLMASSLVKSALKAGYAPT